MFVLKFGVLNSRTLHSRRPMTKDGSSFSLLEFDIPCDDSSHSCLLNAGGLASHVNGNKP